jgi:branched-chain amino acid transport system ATP-binding protein
MVYEPFPYSGRSEKQLAGTLSGGEQQMLAIGRALMSRPKFFFLMSHLWDLLHCWFRKFLI